MSGQLTIVHNYVYVAYTVSDQNVVIPFNFEKVKVENSTRETLYIGYMNLFVS